MLVLLSNNYPPALRLRSLVSSCAIVIAFLAIFGDQTPGPGPELAAAMAATPLRQHNAGPHRRHSLFGTEDRIVLDIGSRCCKVGFSGEAQPRKIFRTVKGACRTGIEVMYGRDTERGEANNRRGDDDDDGLLWHLDLMRSPCPEQARELLKARLTVLLRKVYQDILMIDPTQRKVILIENLFTPMALRECLYAVLFDNLRVPFISPVPAPVSVAFSVGNLTALVVSVGALETSILPIYQGRPLLSHFASSSRAGRSLELRLRALLLRYGRCVKGGDTSTPVAGRTGKLSADMLTLSLLENILAGACYAADPIPTPDPTSNSSSVLWQQRRRRWRDQRSQHLSAATQQATSEEAVPDWQRPHTGDHEKIAKAKFAELHYKEAQDVELLKSLKRRYEAYSSATHIITPMKRTRESVAGHLEDVAVFPTTPSTFMNICGSAVGIVPSPAIGISSIIPDGDSDLVIPGWIRERVADFFWDEQSASGGGSGGDDDDDSRSLQELVLLTLSRLPLDLRRPMCSSILVTGGPVSLPGFAHRMRREVQMKLDRIPITFAETRPVYVGSAEVAKGRKRGHKYAALKHLRDKVAVLNDHYPDLDPSTGRPIAGGGSTPCIPPLLHAWFGGSLAGSLKLSSVETIQREEWDALKLAAASIHSAGAESTTMAVDDSKSGTLKPAVGSKGGRGSFMGVVGGLDTGAFGGLAAISRHMGLSEGTGR